MSLVLLLVTFSTSAKRSARALWSFFSCSVCWLKSGSMMYFLLQSSLISVESASSAFRIASGSDPACESWFDAF